MANGAASNISQGDALSPSHLGSISINKSCWHFVFAIFLLEGLFVYPGVASTDRDLPRSVFSLPESISQLDRRWHSSVRSSFDGVIPGGGGGGCIYV